MRIVSQLPPAADELQGTRLVLRDGSVAAVRVAQPKDRDAIRAFFHALPEDDRFRRFLSAGDPSDAVIDRCCGALDPKLGLTLLASRLGPDDKDRIVAAATYIMTTPNMAEVAFAVAPDFQGHGLATLMLEQLGAYAAVQGYERFVATTLADNAAMLNVFRDSGFTVTSSPSAGCVEVELSLTPTARGVAMAEARRRQATIESIAPILRPGAVAVIGASRDPQKIGSRILTALKAGDYPGGVHVVHPTAGSLQGVPAVRSARDLPSGVDLAIIAVPAEAVLAAAEDCAHAGVRAVVVISAGFAECGPEGRAAQDALLALARGHGMRVVGPNCMGVLNLEPTVRMRASFSPAVPRPGRVALASQSGALGIAVLDLASEREVGLSSFVSLGNKADVSSNDLLEYWETDDATRVVLLYLESFGNARRFARIARRFSRRKPIVALKAGRTEAGRRAAGSHTAALAANDAVVSAIFRQTGVIRADTIDEMFDIAVCLDLQPLPAGNRVAIVTNAGGPGILAADACGVAGLTVATLGDDTRAKLASILATASSHQNPVDMVASAGPDEFRATIEAVMADGNVDAVVAIYTPVETLRSAEILASIGEAVRAGRDAGYRDKPVLLCTMAGKRRAAPLPASHERLPAYMFPENAVRALGKIAGYAAWRAKPEGQLWEHEDVHLDEARRLCREALASRGPGWLTTAETWRLLRAFNVPLAAGGIASSAEEAVALAQTYGFPVAAKIAGDTGQHKTDVGGVRLNLTTPADVRAAYADLAARLVTDAASDGGVVIQPMVTGIETIVGVVQDPVFGSVVGFGLGGVDVELLGDMRFRVAPLTDRDIDELIADTRAARMLHGYRGRGPGDVHALKDVIARISRMAETLRQIEHLDLNPVVVLESGQGCRVVDARIRLRPGS
jgi:acetyl coenzyme A synthetase (ADP forming)-like protein